MQTIDLQTRLTMAFADAIPDGVRKLFAQEPMARHDARQAAAVLERLENEARHRAGRASSRNSDLPRILAGYRAQYEAARQRLTGFLEKNLPLADVANSLSQKAAFEAVQAEHDRLTAELQQEHNANTARANNLHVLHRLAICFAEDEVPTSDLAEALGVELKDLATPGMAQRYQRERREKAEREQAEAERKAAEAERQAKFHEAALQARAGELAASIEEAQSQRDGRILAKRLFNWEPPRELMEIFDGNVGGHVGLNLLKARGARIPESDIAGQITFERLLAHVEAYIVRRRQTAVGERISGVEWLPPYASPEQAKAA